MKVALIISSNYLRSNTWFYSNYFDNKGIKYDVIGWNRKGIKEDNVIMFHKLESEDKGYFGRFLSYMKFRNFIIDVIEKGDYNKVIISTIPIGILLMTYLRKKFKNNYIYDIRDLSIASKIFPKRFKQALDNSFLVVSSSKGFLKYLPSSKGALICHNFPYGLFNVNYLERISSEYKDNIFRISYIGSLRDYNVNVSFIDSFKHKSNYCIMFIGNGPAYNRLNDYVERNGISNVHFTGFYDKKDEKKLLSDTQMLNLLTGNDTNSLSLITNRFYLSVWLGKPMIVYSGTYQGELCKKFCLGCVVDRCDDLLEKVEAYVREFDIDIYNDGRLKFQQELLIDLTSLEDAMSLFLNSETINENSNN